MGEEATGCDSLAPICGDGEMTLEADDTSHSSYGTESIVAKREMLNNRLPLTRRHLNIEIGAVGGFIALSFVLAPVLALRMFWPLFFGGPQLLVTGLIFFYFARFQWNQFIDVKGRMSTAIRLLTTLFVMSGCLLPFCCPWLKVAMAVLQLAVLLVHVYTDPGESPEAPEEEIGLAIGLSATAVYALPLLALMEGT
jgi:hypothetical protein